jgi:ABC-type multidrug transport system permease subunit
LPFFFVIFSLFNGVVRPYSQMPVFWRYWLYYVNPSTWWIGGVPAATLADQPIECAESETAVFNPPPGQSCSSYAGAFAESSGGYLLQPDALSNCMMCPYSRQTATLPASTSVPTISGGILVSSWSLWRPTTCWYIPSSLPTLQALSKAS